MTQANIVVTLPKLGRNSARLCQTLVVTLPKMRIHSRNWCKLVVIVQKIVEMLPQNWVKKRGHLLIDETGTATNATDIRLMTGLSLSLSNSQNSFHFGLLAAAQETK